MKKINLVQVITVVGTAMSLVGTLCSSWAGEQKMKDTIQEKVDEALRNQMKES